jgi:hypothetical protein
VPGQSEPPAGDGHWYYCDATQAYHPYVKGCAVPWRQVAASGPIPPQPRPPLWAQQGGTVAQKVWADQMAEIVSEYQFFIENAKVAAEARKLQEQAAAREMQRKAEDERNGYKYISISDFILDKKTFSSDLKLIIKGYFEPDGDVDWLVEYFGVWSGVQKSAT